jgi:hypothetical protein
MAEIRVILGDSSDDYYELFESGDINHYRDHRFFVVTKEERKKILALLKKAYKNLTKRN